AETTVARASGRQHLAIVADTALDHFERNEALDVGPELAAVLGAVGGAISLQRAIDLRLRQRRIEVARGALRNQDQRRTIAAVMLTVGLPQHALLGIGRRYQEQWPA